MEVGVCQLQYEIFKHYLTLSKCFCIVFLEFAYTISFNSCSSALVTKNKQQDVNSVKGPFLFMMCFLQN